MLKTFRSFSTLKSVYFSKQRFKALWTEASPFCDPKTRSILCFHLLKIKQCVFQMDQVTSFEYHLAVAPNETNCYCNTCVSSQLLTFKQYLKLQEILLFPILDSHTINQQYLTWNSTLMVMNFSLSMSRSLLNFATIEIMFAVQWIHSKANNWKV